MDNELPDVEISQDELLGVKPRPALLTFAAEVHQSADTEIPILMLAQALEIGMSRCKEEAVKRALIESARDLNGPVARLTRQKLNRMLPPYLKTVKIENIIIRLGAIAAEVPELWNLITPE